MHDSGAGPAQPQLDNGKPSNSDGAESHCDKVRLAIAMDLCYPSIRNGSLVIGL